MGITAARRGVLGRLCLAGEEIPLGICAPQVDFSRRKSEPTDGQAGELFAREMQARDRVGLRVSTSEIGAVPPMGPARVSGLSRASVQGRAHKKTQPAPTGMGAGCRTLVRGSSAS